VDPDQHSAADVGDEPLMLAQTGEAWIGADRGAAGQEMSSDGVDIILMDDGHQNPGLHKDLSLIVVDSVAGFGNGFVIPKGPLREPVLEGLSRADAVIVLGDGPPPAIIFDSGLPVFHGRIAPTREIEEGSYVAFAGIGRPEKFFDTLTNAGAVLADAIPYPDHYTYTPSDLRYLRQLARERGARLITTEKDMARLAPADRYDIETLPIELQFDQIEALDKLIADVIKPSANGKD
jgi:tetraacyldisaccharide 4'-kinase